MTPGRAWTARAILALALVAAGCSGPAQHEAAPDAMELPEARIRDLIRHQPGFGDALTVEVMSEIVSPTARALAEDGYLRLEDHGPARVSLTDKGRQGGMVEWDFEQGKPFFKVPVGHRELVEVTRVEDWPRAVPARRVEFTYRRAASPIGKDLLAAGSRIGELDAATLFHGEARFVRGPEGWKVHSLSL